MSSVGASLLAELSDGLSFLLAFIFWETSSAITTSSVSKGELGFACMLSSQFNHEFH